MSWCVLYEVQTLNCFATHLHIIPVGAVVMAVIRGLFFICI